MNGLLVDARRMPREIQSHPATEVAPGGVPPTVGLRRRPPLIPAGRRSAADLRGAISNRGHPPRRHAPAPAGGRVAAGLRGAISIAATHRADAHPSPQGDGRPQACEGRFQSRLPYVSRPYSFGQREDAGSSQRASTRTSDWHSDQLVPRWQGRVRSVSQVLAHKLKYTRLWFVVANTTQAC